LMIQQLLQNLYRCLTGRRDMILDKFMLDRRCWLKIQKIRCTPLFFHCSKQ